MEQQACHRKEKQEQNKSKYAYISGQAALLKCIEAVNNLFRKAVECRTHRLIKGSARSDHSVAHEPHHVANMTAVQMKEKMFSGKNRIPIFAFSQDFKSACDACGVHKRAALWLYMRSLTRFTEAAVKFSVPLRNPVNSGHDGALRTYYEVVKFLLKRYGTDDKIEKLDNEVDSLKQGTFSPTIFAQQLWSKTLTSGYVSDEKALKATFVEEVQSSIRKT